MEVNGISSNYMYQIQNAMNLARLSSVRQAADKPVSPVKPVAPVDSSSSAYTDIQGFLGSYQSGLTGLESTALKLADSSSKNVFNDYKVASSNEKAVTASGRYGLKGDTDLTLHVESLAQAQQNTSTAHDSEEAVKPGADMEFQVNSANGSAAVAVSSTNENGTQKTYRQMYQEAAKAVNSQPELGVKASATNTNGKVSLVLTAADTGGAKGFRVTGNTGAAAGIDKASAAAQDAVYTVTDNGSAREYRSDTNKISLDYGRIEAEFKGTGESRVHTGIDEDSVVSAVDDLVKGYNSVTGLLKENSNRGTGAAAHLSSFKRGMADEITLKAIGITHDKDDNLKLDKDKLKSALEHDFEGTRSLIGGQFGIAEKVSAKTHSALSDSVQRIVGKDLASAMAPEKEHSSADFRYLSNFARSGPYNLGNFYTVGLLLNTMA